MASSTPLLMVSLIALSIYSYSAYYMLYKIGNSQLNLIPPGHKKYGQWRFLTFLTLNVQILNYLLHVLAHFIKPLQSIRDLVHTALAVPLANVVCISFWAIWLLMGRELIFPAALDAFFPNWLNHAVHTLILPMNLIASAMVHHKYYKLGPATLLSFLIPYVGLLYYIKSDSGYFVYKYLDEFSDLTRLFYFVLTGIFSVAMYKSGEIFTYAVHGKKVHEGVRATSQKKKQK